MIRVLPVTDEGRLDLDRLEEIVTGRCKVVAVTHASNVTGALTDLARIVAAARAVGARVLVDGAQRAPHGPLDVPALGVDAYAISGHKMFGPTGGGALWIGRPARRAAAVSGRRRDDQPGHFRPDRIRARAASLRGRHAGDRRGDRHGRGRPLPRSLDWQAATRHELALTERLLDGLSRIPASG